MNIRCYFVKTPSCNAEFTGQSYCPSPVTVNCIFCFQFYKFAMFISNVCCIRALDNYDFTYNESLSDSVLLSICLSLCLSVCLSLSLYICMSVSVLLSLYYSLSFYLSIYRSESLAIYCYLCISFTLALTL